MTAPQSASDKAAGNLSQGAKTHCIDIFTTWKFKRNEQVYSKFIEKGNELEEDAITLISGELLTVLEKNEINLVNDWITGTPDCYTGKSIDSANTVEDTKCSWDIFTFNRAKYSEKINPAYLYQMHGYMWLTGASSANIRYCLLNPTADLLDDEKRKLAWAMRVTDFSRDERYTNECKRLERLMICDLPSFLNRYPNYNLETEISKWEFDIPASERVHTIPIERDESVIEQIKNKVEKAREFIQTLQ